MPVFRSISTRFTPGRVNKAFLIVRTQFLQVMPLILIRVVAKVWFFRSRNALISVLNINDPYNICTKRCLNQISIYCVGLLMPRNALMMGA